MSPLGFLQGLTLFERNGNLSFQKLVVPPGFEPGSWDPEPHMMDHYTKGLMKFREGLCISRKPKQLYD